MTKIQNVLPRCEKDDHNIEYLTKVNKIWLKKFNYDIKV